MMTSIVRTIFGIIMLHFFSTTHIMGATDDQTLLLAAIALAFILLGAGCELVGGFWGVVNWEEPLLAYKSVRFGIFTLAFGLIGNLLQGLTGYGISYVAWVTGAVVPALFLIAAIHFQVKHINI